MRIICSVSAQTDPADPEQPVPLTPLDKLSPAPHLQVIDDCHREEWVHHGKEEVCNEIRQVPIRLNILPVCVFRCVEVRY